MSSLRRALHDYCAGHKHSFHTPGHKGADALVRDILVPQYDLTELPGLDMLHNPTGVIAEAQRSAARSFGADASFFLVNGATAGNQAMLLAVAPALAGRKIRIDRRAHRSVQAALILSGLRPDYIQPVIHPEFNLALGLDTRCIIAGHTHDIGAYHMTDPAYYGTTVDSEALISWRDNLDADFLILIDQAHGAHFYGGLFPPNALELGADMVLHSTHKTLGALTQAAMLHVKGKRADAVMLQKSLELLQSSSPSYLLLASLEKSAELLHSTDWAQRWNDLYEQVMILRQKLQDRLRILTAADEGSYGIKSVDWSKILINVSPLNISAGEVVDILRTAYAIEPELWDERNILFMLGIGTNPQDICYLSEALEQIVNTYYNTNHNTGGAADKKQAEILRAGIEIPPLQLTPRDAWFSKKKKIKLNAALGCTSAETISIYPPGIPLVAAGEMITRGVLEILSHSERFRWQGWDGFNHNEIWIVNE